METAIADTGFVVALLNRSDTRHQDMSYPFIFSDRRSFSRKLP